MPTLWEELCSLKDFSTSRDIFVMPHLPGHSLLNHLILEISRTGITYCILQGEKMSLAKLCSLPRVIQLTWDVAGDYNGFKV